MASTPVLNCHSSKNRSPKEDSSFRLGDGLVGMQRTAMPDILITEFMDGPAVAMLRERFDVAYHPDLQDRQEDIPALMAGVKGLIVRNQTQVRGAVLEAADSLLCVGRLGVGLDNIDMADCGARGVDVFPAAGANSDSVAEMAIGALFVLFRGCYHVTEKTLSGEWPRQSLMGFEVNGKTLGVAGFGSIGRALAWRAKGVGMKVVAWDPYVPADAASWSGAGVERAATMDALLAASDAVSVHVPLNGETRDLIDANAIAKLRKGALVLNLARGGVVNEADLAAGLKSGHLGGAFLDVFDTEPLPAGNIFKDVPNLIVTPHAGARTVEAETRVSNMIANAVADRVS